MLAPVAFNVAVSPEQSMTGLLLAVIVGVGLTVIAIVLVASQPEALAPVTV